MNKTKIYARGILILYHLPFKEEKAVTTVDHIRSFAKYSTYPVYQIDTVFGFPKKASSYDFDVTLLHYSVFSQSGYHLAPQCLEYLQTTSAYKVTIFQDEFHHCQRRFNFINKYKIDAIYSCYEPQYYNETYKKYTSVEVIRTYIPGHISDGMLDAAKKYAKPEAKRTIDIGYRGRKLPYYAGRGAREKYIIGNEMLAKATQYDICVNIGVEEDDRIYGKNWYKFLGNCNAVLGTESGVSYTDVEDVVRPQCEELIKKNYNITFEDVYQQILLPWEGNIPYRTIRPRHFEAAVFKCCHILFTGKYSGLMKPMVHYIPLEKDFSNLDEVIKLFRNDKFRREITERTYRDIVESERFTYNAFIAQFDTFLREFGALSKPTAKRSSYVDIIINLHNTIQYNKRNLKYLKKLVVKNLPCKKYIQSLKLGPTRK